jgi:hypothetical protein
MEIQQIMKGEVIDKIWNWGFLLICVVLASHLFMFVLKSVVENEKSQPC